MLPQQERGRPPGPPCGGHGNDAARARHVPPTLPGVRPLPALADRLRDLARRYDRAFIDTDPLRWPKSFDDPDDQEVAGVVAASLAYGRVASIHRSVAAVLERLGPRPARALDRGRRRALGSALAGFRHRFTAGADVAWLLEGVARARDEAGSLGAFVAAHAVGPEPLRSGLAAWHALARTVETDDDPVRRRARAFLLPDPFSGTALKRTLLLSRWFVRGGDGIDLGIWKAPGRLEPRHLVLPLDTHVHRTALDLGLTRRTIADWKAAIEATATLARFDPDDPVRFDFALVRPGIVGKCVHRTVPVVCLPCELRDCCRKGRRVPESAVRVERR